MQQGYYHATDLYRPRILQNLQNKILYLYGIVETLCTIVGEFCNTTMVRVEQEESRRHVFFRLFERTEPVRRTYYCRKLTAA